MTRLERILFKHGFHMYMSTEEWNAWIAAGPLVVTRREGHIITSHYIRFMRFCKQPIPEIQEKILVLAGRPVYYQPGVEDFFGTRPSLHSDEAKKR